MWSRGIDRKAIWIKSSNNHTLKRIDNLATPRLIFIIARKILQWTILSMQSRNKMADI